MTVNKRAGRFHDPWGNSRGNHGSVINHQYLVGIKMTHYGENDKIAGATYVFDKVKLIERKYDRYVLGPYSLEKLRR